MQENVNRTREENAQRKMSKIQSREWDSDKSKEPGKAKRPDRFKDASISTPTQDKPIEHDSGMTGPLVSTLSDTALPRNPTLAANGDDRRKIHTSPESSSSTMNRRGLGSSSRGRGSRATGSGIQGPSNR